MSDPRLRFRVFIDGELTAEAWLDCSAEDAEAQLDSFKAKHARLTEWARECGLPWTVEVYDPDQPPGEGYVRFGWSPPFRPVRTIQAGPGWPL